MFPFLQKSMRRLRHNFWFIPLVMIIGAIALSFLMLELDKAIDDADIAHLRTFFTKDVDGARLVLSTIAGSMITVAGVVFSLVVVAMSLTAIQSGPRLLILFMRSRTTQIVLGTYPAVFIYAFMILRAIQAEESIFFLPHFSVAVSVLLAIGSFLVLIYFIHNTARMIQLPNIVASVGHELEETIRLRFPNKIGKYEPLPDTHHVLQGLTYAHTAYLRSPRSGYIRFLDLETLFDLAVEHDLVIHSLLHEGNFIPAGGHLAQIWANNPLSETLENAIQNAIVLDTYRKPEQDLELLFNELVEIALRAISAAINDPFTAMNCIDWLSAGLCQLAERELSSPYRYDADGRLRLIVYRLRFKSAVDDAFNQIRQCSQTNIAVSIRLLEALRQIALRLKRPEDSLCVRQHAEMIRHGVELSPLEPNDKRDIESRYHAVLEALEAQ